ncbi:42 kDa peptidyl-prolyl isomerase, partial [Trifolium pratense]
GKENADEVVDESSEYGKGETPEELLSRPPKVDSEVEVLHEKVTKQIIKEGHGQKPSKYSTCFWFPRMGTLVIQSSAARKVKSGQKLFMSGIELRAWAENTEHKFEDTWQEQRPIEMVIGKGIVEV